MSVITFVKRSAVLLGLLAFLGISSHAENKVVLKNPGLKVGDQFGLTLSWEGQITFKGIKDFTDPNFQPPEDEEKGITKDNFVYAGGDIEIIGQVSLVKATGLGLTEVDLSQSSAIKIVDFGANKITSVVLGDNNKENLNDLKLEGNLLDKLELPALNGLEILNCAGNKLTKLELPPLKNLISLNCSRNQISSLDLLSLPLLSGLRCQNNVITSIKLSPDNKQYNDLLIHNNQIKAAEMEAIVNALHNAPQVGFGNTRYVIVIDTKGVDRAEGYQEGNECPTNLIEKANEKKWVLCDGDEFTKYTGGGVVPSTKASISFVKTGEGTVEFFIGDKKIENLKEVEKGATVRVVATPAEKYSLTSIETVIDGKTTDITEAKSFKLTANAQVKVVFSTSGAVSEVEANQLCLYPNPSSDVVYIAGEAGAEVRIYSLDGKEMFRGDLNAEGEIAIEVKAFAKGTYLAKVGRTVSKFVVR